MRRLAEGYSMGARLASVPPVGVSAAQHFAAPDAAYPALRDVCSRALPTEGGDVVLLTGAAMAGLEVRLSAELGVPVVCGLAAGIGMAALLSVLPGAEGGAVSVPPKAGTIRGYDDWRAYTAQIDPLFRLSQYFRSVTKREVSEALQAAMRAKGLTFVELAAELGCPRVWLAAAVLGQHPFPRDVAEKLAEMLGLAEDAVGAMQQIPTRGGLDTAVPVDPTIYRLYEVIQVYGPALKALLHEEFGDGIMSAINFRADIERVPDPAGDRVRITLDGKFLPYQWE